MTVISPKEYGGLNVPKVKNVSRCNFEEEG